MMGCCVSIDKEPPPPHFHRHSSFSTSNRGLPPPSKEETVEEVLSETPNPKPYLPKIEDEPKKLTSKQTLHEIQEAVNYKNDVVKKPNSINPTAEEVSEEVSEICSTLSESISTVTFNEKRDNDVSGEVRQRMPTNRSSPAKYRNRQASGDLRRERVVGKSPVRCPEQSPGRVKSTNGRERRVVAHGESSGPGQRSRSPNNPLENKVAD